MREKSCVYFMLNNGTEINTEVVHTKNATNDAVVKKAKLKLNIEIGLNIDFVADVVGRNKCYDGDWIFVDFLEDVIE